MKTETTPLQGLVILSPNIHPDGRGFFFESYNKNTYSDLGIDCDFVQDNMSFSSFGTLRGLHFQKEEFAQAKLVSVIQGRVLDVVVDLREDSATYGKSFSVELSEENKKQFFVPRGFAHGFSVLSETALFYYKCDNFYHKESEAGLLYNDPNLGIDWQINLEKAILSDKDKSWPQLTELKQEEKVF